MHKTYSVWQNMWMRDGGLKPNDVAVWLYSLWNLVLSVLGSIIRHLKPIVNTYMLYLDVIFFTVCL